MICFIRRSSSLSSTSNSLFSRNPSLSSIFFSQPKFFSHAKFLSAGPSATSSSPRGRVFYCTRKKLKDATEEKEKAEQGQAEGRETALAKQKKEAAVTASKAPLWRRVWGFLRGPPLLHSRLWQWAKAEAKHYYLGFKLLALNVNQSRALVMQVLRGNSLSRRERRHLMRTVADLFRLVPFIVIVAVPFLEFCLPVLVKVFPNMLPSTFEGKLQKEEKLKSTLRVKLEMAKFLQGTVQEMADSAIRDDPEMSKKFDIFMGRVRRGERVSGAELDEYSHLFEDDFTLDNLSRSQLASVCRFLNLRPYGTDAFLRMQIERRLASLAKDDQMIVAEGVENLTTEELQQACAARGMRAHGVSDYYMRAQLQGWLEMSLVKRVPSLVLVLSRILMITANVDPEEAMRKTLSAMPDEVFSEAELRADEISGETDIALKMEVLTRDMEKIRQESLTRELTDREVEEWEDQLERNIASTSAHLKDVTEALSSLSAESSVNRERKELEKLKAEYHKYKEAKKTSIDAAREKKRKLREKQKQKKQKKGEGEDDEESEDELEEQEKLKLKQKQKQQQKPAAGPRPGDEAGLPPSTPDSYEEAAARRPERPADVADEDVHGRFEKDADVDVDDEEEKKKIDDEEKEKSRTSRVENRIEGMLKALDVELQEVDDTVGEKLKLLDLDGDGVISEHEIAVALENLRIKPTKEQLREALLVLDPDRDGKLLLSDINRIQEALDNLESNRKD